MDKRDTEKKTGDDIMAAAETNYVYKVIVKGKEKIIPAIAKEKIDAYKAAISKYSEKK